MADKMIDLGKMYSTDELRPATKPKPHKEYPSVWIRDIELPLSPTDVGKTFLVTGKIHVTGIEERVRENRARKGKEYNFELRSIQIHNQRGKLKAALKKNVR